LGTDDLISQDDLNALLGGLSVGEKEDVPQPLEEMPTVNAEVMCQDDIDKLLELYRK